MDLAAELRERTALRYAGNCKCGKCQLVPRDMINAAAREIERLRAVIRVMEVGAIDRPPLSGRPKLDLEGYKPIKQTG